MALRDLAAYLEDDGLDYTFWPSFFEAGDDGEPRFPQGKACDRPDCPKDGLHCHYKVQSPSGKTGLWLVALNDIAMKATAGVDLAAEDLARVRLDDDHEKTLYEKVLGAAYQQMLDDGVKWTVLQHHGQDAYRYFVMSPDAADAVLAGQGEAQARTNRAARRTAKQTAGSRSRRASTAATESVKAPTSPTSGSSTSPNESEEAQTAKAV